MCSRIRSSFHGRIQEIPGIAVDNFEGVNLESRAFFLSHCHSDHTQGLFSRELLNILVQNKVFIYMSEMSAAIVADDCKHDPTLMEHVRPLKIGTTHITLPSLYNYEEMYVRVTLIHAGHCLGSVMFLLETRTKTVLYTGDFNISSNDIAKFSAFHKNKEPIELDALYVDTTFISWNYDYFPKRSNVVEDVINIIQQWLSSDKNNRVALSVSAKYGYEYVYNKIYEKLGEKVHVNDDRMAFYGAHPNITNGVTNKESETRIHICRNIQDGGQHKLCSITQITGYNFLFIRFSAMKWDKYEFEETAIRRPTKNRVDVCYATHCSRTQIISFVSYFSPKKVVGFPNPYSSTSPNKRVYIPENNAVKIEPIKRKFDFEDFSPEESRSCKPKKDKLVDKEVLRQIFDF